MIHATTLPMFAEQMSHGAVDSNASGRLTDFMIYYFFTKPKRSL